MIPQSILIYHNILMDEKTYPRSTIDTFMEENLFFKDAKLKKYYERNEQRDLKKFRERLRSAHKDKSFEKIVYVVITDSIRDIILDTIGELTTFLKKSGDLIVSGGEAFNLYVDFQDRIVTGDIDAKFVPRMRPDSKYFGKLQALKLILWNKLGDMAKRLNMRIKNRVMSKYGKLFKYIGLGFKKTGPYVTRRYTLIKKKKTRENNNPGKGDVFIDVELFALDLNLRHFVPSSGRIEDVTVGGILDIPFMRPDEFGYDVARTKRVGMTYIDTNTGKVKVNKKIFVASKEFLIEDIYLMHRLKLRPEKKEKDRKRLVRLGKLFSKSVRTTDSIEDIFKKVRSKIISKPTNTTRYKNVNVRKALKVDPRKYEKYTTEPSKERLSKQIVHGIKTTTKNTKIENYEKTSGNKRFNLDAYKWKTVKNKAYVKNEQNLRPVQAKKIPSNLNTRDICMVTDRIETTGYLVVYSINRPISHSSG